jgi:hypothetical protein
MSLEVIAVEKMKLVEKRRTEVNVILTSRNNKKTGARKNHPEGDTF